MSPFFFPRFPSKAVICTGIFLCLSASGAHAEMRTLTDNQGRSLTAEVVSVEGDNVTIRRDDGQTFTLSLATLSADDQKSLKKWAGQQASAIPPGGVELQISRGKFETKKKDEGAVILSEEQWGFTATLFNRTSKTLTGARVDYILFVKPDAEPGKDTVKVALKQQKGSKDFSVINPRESVNFRTNSIIIYKQQLKPGWVWAKTGGNSVIKDTLYGVWLRVYIGNQLVGEVCSPEGLSKTEKWAAR